jgi:hypothetical protein
MSGESASPYEETMKELRALGMGGGKLPPIAPQLPHGDDPGMEGRVKRLEDDVRAIRGDLTTILGRLGTMEGRLGAVEGKLDLLVTQIVAKIPSGLQLFSLMVGTLVAILGLLGGAIGIAQYLKLIPR